MLATWGVRLLLLGAAVSHTPLEQHRQEQLGAVQAAFSRFTAQGPDGAIPRLDLQEFVSYVVASMSSAAVPQDQATAQAAELTRRLRERLPPDASRYTLAQILSSTERLIDKLPADDAPDAPEGSSDRGRVGSKQLRKLREQLAENRLTMPLFDTKGWVRDFEKALKTQWEIYANGLQPMHIVVARSDRLYGRSRVIE